MASAGFGHPKLNWKSMIFFGFIFQYCTLIQEAIEQYRIYLFLPQNANFSRTLYIMINSSYALHHACRISSVYQQIYKVAISPSIGTIRAWLYSASLMTSRTVLRLLPDTSARNQVYPVMKVMVVLLVTTLAIMVSFFPGDRTCTPVGGQFWFASTAQVGVVSHLLFFEDGKVNIGLFLHLNHLDGIICVKTVDSQWSGCEVAQRYG